MEFRAVRPSATNYYTYFSANRDEQRHLFRFIDFMLENDVYEKVFGDPKFAPSRVWENWLSSTFVGFSNDAVLLKSGHRFINSCNPIIFPSFYDGKILPLAKNILMTIRAYFRLYKSDTVDLHLREFSKIYPNAKIPSRQ